jgi:hypothetical protein
MLRKTLLTVAVITLAPLPAYGATNDPASRQPPTVTVTSQSTVGGGANLSVQGHQDPFGLRKPGYHGAVSHTKVGSRPPKSTTSNITVQSIFADCDPADKQVADTYSAIGLGDIGVIICLYRPFATPTPGTNKPTVTPTQPPAEVTDFARDFFQSVALPQPQPVISAPEGICGVVHTLNLHMPTEQIYTYNDTNFGDVTMHLYGTVSVDWGDGSAVDKYHDGGADFPNSDIGHSYTTVGHYRITATASWTAQITIGPYQGGFYDLVIGGVTTSGQIPDFQVIQLQAVITEG